MPPRVSVVMSTRNRAGYLRETAGSILAQSAGDFELIIGDNHSEDATWDILRELAAGDARLTVYRNSTDLGAAGGNNLAAAKATAPWMIFAGDDDPWLPDRLAVLLDLLGSGEGLSAVYTDWLRIGPDGAPLETEQERLRRRQPPPDNRSLTNFYRHCRAPDFRLVLGLLRTDLFKDNPPLSPMAPHVGAYSDGPLLFRALTRGEVRYRPVVTFHKREGHGWQYAGGLSADPAAYLTHVQAHWWYWHTARLEMAAAPLSPARRAAFRLGAAQGFNRVFFKLTRQFRERISQDPAVVNDFFAGLNAFAGEKHLPFGQSVLWCAKSLWPVCSAPLRALGLTK